MQCRSFRKCGFDPWVVKISWRRRWLPTLVFLPRKSHGHRSLASYSPLGHQETNRIEVSYHNRHICSVNSSKYNDSFTSSFPVWLSFIFFSCVFAVTGTSMLCWIEVVRIGNLVLFQILVEGFSPCHSWVLYWLFITIVINSIYYVDTCSLYTQFGERFFFFLSWMGVEFYQMCFLYLLRWPCSFCLFFFWCSVTLVDLHMLSHSCDPGMNPSWS